MPGITERIPPLGWTLIGSIFASLAIVFPAAWLLAPLGLAAFFLGLLRARSIKRAALHGFLFGLITGGAGIGWFWDTLPLDWMNVPEGKQWYFVLMSWGQVTIVFGLTVAVGAALIARAMTYRFGALAVALLWVVIEWAKMWAFSILTYSERVLLGPHFSATALGYPLAEQSYLLQIAEGGGVYALTFVVALMASLLAFMVAGRAKEWGVIAASLALLALLIYPLVQQPHASAGMPLEVAIYTSDFPIVGGAKGSTTEYLAALASTEETAPNADVILIPEVVRLEPSFASSEERRLAHAQVFGERDPLIVSSSHALSEQSFSLLLSYDTASGKHLGSYSKMFLMPGGEYMPWLLERAFLLASDSALKQHLGTLAKRALPGTEVTAITHAGWTMSGFICSDFLSPELHRDAGERLGANLMVNLANPSWFHHSRTLYDKTLQISKVHAVQHRSYYLHSSNGSRSYAIAPSGTVIAETPWHFTGTLPVTIE